MLLACFPDNPEPMGSPRGGELLAKAITKGESYFSENIDLLAKPHLGY